MKVFCQPFGWGHRYLLTISLPCFCPLYLRYHLQPVWNAAYILSTEKSIVNCLTVFYYDFLLFYCILIILLLTCPEPAFGEGRTINLTNKKIKIKIGGFPALFHSVHAVTVTLFLVIQPAYPRKIFVSHVILKYEAMCVRLWFGLTHDRQDGD